VRVCLRACVHACAAFAAIPPAPPSPHTPRRSHAVSALPEWYPTTCKDRFTSAAPDEIEYVLGRILPDKVGGGYGCHG